MTDKEADVTGVGRVRYTPIYVPQQTEEERQRRIKRAAAQAAMASMLGLRVTAVSAEGIEYEDDDGTTQTTKLGHRSGDNP